MNMNIGVLLVFISSICFALSSYFAKLVTNITSMSGVITSFSRFSIGAISMFIYIVATRKSFKTPDIKPIIFRAVYNSIAIILFSMAYNYTTITNVNMLNMTYPLFVILIAPYFTKEVIKKTTYIYLVIIMLGVYTVANPQFGNFNIGDLLALISAVFAALSILSLTKSRVNNEGYIIVFYVMLIGTLVNIPTAANDLSNFDYNGLLPVLVAGILGFLGQVLLTWGYKYVDSATGALVATSRIILGVIIGYIFLREPLNLRIIIGVVLITLSLVGISGYFSKKEEI